MADTKETPPVTKPPEVKALTLAEASAKLDVLTKFYEDPKFKAPGFNPFFMLKRLFELKAELASPKLQEAAIKEIMSIKQAEPTLASLNLEAQLYRAQ